MSKELNKKEEETNKQDDHSQTDKQETPPEEAKDQDKVDNEQEDPSPPSTEELKELRNKAAKAEEFYERLLRQVAETDNLRKRLAKEKQDAIRYANESLIEQLLPTMDSFDMAISAVKKNQY